jgi:choline-sulfatase
MLRIAAALLLVFVGAGQLAAQEPRRPNVLMIAIDDLNDWVSPLDGHPAVKTPHFELLAKSGTTFLNAHCQAPLCNPSRTSMMLSLRPTTSGVYALEPWFRTVPEIRDHVPLFEHFKLNGYRVYSVGKLWHGGIPREEIDRQFTELGTPGKMVRPEKPFTETPAGHPLMDWGPFPERDEDHYDYHTANWAIRKLESRPEEPFFLAVGFSLPHVPLYAPPRWFDLYPNDDSILPPVKRNEREHVPPFAWYLHWDLPEPRLAWLKRAEQWQPLTRAYLASVSFVDAQVGRVLDALEASGQAENTIVVLWSDHGYHLGEKEISGKNTLWERSTRVPLMFAGPGVARDSRCERPVELLDIYPTLVQLCDLPVRPGLEGQTLVPLLVDPTAPREMPAITSHGPGNHSVRSQQWRYIRYADGSEELYNLADDPHEWTNLSDEEEHEDLKRTMASILGTTSAKPAPGSKSRLIELRDGVVYWENRPIGKDEPVPE